MRPAALRAQLAADGSAGMRPMCVVVTVGTTSTTSADPFREIAEITREVDCWLHVDAAYAGIAAILPEHRHFFDGIEFADSIVVNPHKWLFVPIDFSALYVRRPEIVRRTFSLVADYLLTPEEQVHNYMDYGLQLGRRFRALKLWFVLRHLGAKKIRETLRAQIALAQEFAAWVRSTPQWEVLAPHPFSVVCFRHVPKGLKDDDFDEHNRRIMDLVNASGEAYLSSTQLDGRVALRLAIGNYRTTRDDVFTAWTLLREAAS